MAIVSQIILDTPAYTDFRDSDPAIGYEGFRRVWKPGTDAYNDAQIRAAINAEIDAVTAETARLRDTNVVYTTQQLRNDLARLGDDVVKLARLMLGRLESQ